MLHSIQYYVMYNDYHLNHTLYLHPQDVLYSLLSRLRFVDGIHKHQWRNYALTLSSVVAFRSHQCLQWQKQPLSSHSTGPAYDDVCHLRLPDQNESQFCVGRAHGYHDSTGILRRSRLPKGTPNPDSHCARLDGGDYRNASVRVPPVILDGNKSLSFRLHTGYVDKIPCVLLQTKGVTTPSIIVLVSSKVILWYWRRDYQETIIINEIHKT